MVYWWYCNRWGEKSVTGIIQIKVIVINKNIMAVKIEEYKDYNIKGFTID